MFYVPVNIAILSSEVKNMHKNKLGNKNWLYNMDPLWKVLGSVSALAELTVLNNPERTPRSLLSQPKGSSRSLVELSEKFQTAGRTLK